jgi:hypothetical protein
LPVAILCKPGFFAFSSLQPLFCGFFHPPFASRVAKNKTRYQNIPSRYQIGATLPPETARKEAHGLPSIDTVKAHYPVVAVSI